MSHTNIENGFLVPACQTLIQDPTTLGLYPNADAFCTLNQNTLPIQTFNCFATPNAFCTISAVDRKPVIEGANYQTTGNHGLVFQRLKNGCNQNGVLVDCDSDPLTYAFVAPVPASRQIKDSGQIFPTGGASFWLGGNLTGGDNFLIGLSTETQFESAQVLPFEFHAKAGDAKTFTLNGNQNANWTFTGSAGTTTPSTPSQGTSIQFHAPSTVPVQQVDTLKACKVDISHGTDCNTAQIIVEVLGVTMDPGNRNELLGGENFTYRAIVTQGAREVDLPVTWAITADTSGGLDLSRFIDPESGIVTVPPQSVFQGKDFVVDIQATSTVDPTVAFSAPFAIHIPTVSVEMTTTPFPGQNEPPFEGRIGRVLNFAAHVSGPVDPENTKITSWGQSFIPTLTDFSEPGEFRVPDPNNPNVIEYVISSPPPKGSVSTTIKACVGGRIDFLSGGLRDAICASYLLMISAPLFPTSPPQTINSGESTLVTITGTGFGAAPVLSFSDPTVSFTPGSISGPDANG
ncbi:MAG TPA: hypothetical protein VFF39_01970, partial [Verrucomicrobiae bacterium]|nr:hypothetical protein [Verrucomicrobiae bacterium]